MDILDLEGKVLIVGGGIAGLMTALKLAPEPCVLLSKAAIGEDTSSILAQGGIAACVGADDSVALQVGDTLAAGDGLCDAPVVEKIIAGAPAAIEDLLRLGVRFDRAADGSLKLGLEAAHSRNRIVHAGGDKTGSEIVLTLAAAARATPSITILEGFAARRLSVEDGEVAGLMAEGPNDAVFLRTNRVVIATGGVSGLFSHGTNPVGSWGQGLAIAARAGATLRDVEFVQFHPTALDAPGPQVSLISEAVRGEGAILVDETGRRFMEGVPGKELAPRDVVARAVWSELRAGHRTFLDARGIEGLDFAVRFPGITQSCRAAGIDPIRQPIPIRPAAHYHMGGIKVDLAGRTDVEGLWAVGEAAATGLHGANRLASNSLLEALVCAGFVADDIKAAPRRPVRLGPIGQPARPSDPQTVRAILSRAAGVLRDGADLRRAAAELYPLAGSNDAALVGLMIVVAALRREESRGAHYRLDSPHKEISPAVPRTLDLPQAFDAARNLANLTNLAFADVA
ncbi:L-aspartate oxidase [Methylovirgula ligni]|uniref:L-aspartate oxidase n=1 Tax=Methylovirgula ligni TaxID=569860 RepID=A0A3D9YXD0_9HYPH|nr:L-aspartate oxidase [Methylovirgula ligni]QAY94701.1 L-aspartate oxidase [Methylovirgula ligni]REF87413.1 L-aspartate oxidase [Methylovirgula ligni]